MNSQKLAAAKSMYYNTMINAIHASSENTHWDAASHLEAVAKQCIMADFLGSRAATTKIEKTYTRY
jgi:hypothetical protein